MLTTFDVRFGSKADMCGATAHVRFTPNSDRKSGHTPEGLHTGHPKMKLFVPWTVELIRVARHRTNARSRELQKINALSAKRIFLFEKIHWASRRSRHYGNVRCYSNSGQTRVRLDCPLSANSGHLVQHWHIIIPAPLQFGN
jgi:hypothetical protein